LEKRLGHKLLAMMKVESREAVTAAEALKVLSGFTNGQAMLNGDMFFQLQRVQEELRRVAASEDARQGRTGAVAKS
jgi:hypothetical protein